MQKMFRVLPGDQQGEGGAGDRERQDGEHRHRVQERVELRGSTM